MKYGFALFKLKLELYLIFILWNILFFIYGLFYFYIMLYFVLYFYFYIMLYFYFIHCFIFMLDFISMLILFLFFYWINIIVHSTKFFPIIFHLNDEQLTFNTHLCIKSLFTKIYPEGSLLYVKAKNKSLRGVV